MQAEFSFCRISWRKVLIQSNRELKKKLRTTLSTKTCCRICFALSDFVRSQVNHSIAIYIQFGEVN